jgi:hypothetical protein
MSTPSLLNVPYRLKAGTLYSQIPETGAGDFAVTRSASNVATRINSLGFIETVADNVPRLDYPLGGAVNGCPALLVEPSAVNYLLRSQEFDNASWGKNATGINTSIGTNGIEANVAISPDGTQNADRVNFLLQPDADLGLTQNYAAATSGQTYNMSIWFKGEGANIGKQIKVQMKRISGGTFVGSTSTITLTSGWVRFTSPAITLGASNSGVQVIVSSNDATNTLIWGSQLEQGSIATSYIGPTTTAAITRGADLIRKTGITSLIGQSEGTVYFEVEVTGEARDRWICSIDSSVNSFIQMAITASRTILVSSLNAGSTVISPLTSSALSVGYHKIAFAYNTATNGCIMYIDGVQNPVATRTVVAPGLPAFNDMSVGNFRSSNTDVLKAHVRADALYPNRLSDTELATLTAP